MRLFLLTAVTMTAFAANSVLNRMAVGQGWISPQDFAVERLLSGAGMLVLILGARLAVRRGVVWPRPGAAIAGVGGLILYLLGFSIAYGVLDAGTGALILFGMVQVTMFTGAILAREAVSPARWMGAGLAFAGLAFLVAPTLGAATIGIPTMAMAVAGFGWGVYSLAGRRQRDALAATALNFVAAVPVMLCLLALLPVSPEGYPRSFQGTFLAVLSGAVTSGLGYALWYAILPSLGAARAAVAQLTVPLIAAAGGAMLIGEVPGWRFAVASVLILGGVAWASRQSGLTSR